jgi:hypothetical protein
MTGMPMKVHPSHTGEVAAAHTAPSATRNAATSAAASSSSTSFAGLLAKESATTAPGTDTTTTTPVATTDTAAVNLRTGETMSPVDGHAYAEISGGKRDGLFVNTSHNKRRGQAFVLVVKHGREYHIYGSGKDRVVVALRKRDDAPKASATPTDAAAGTGGAKVPTVSAS